MIRDEELKRLIKYAEGMGVSVKFKPYVKYSRNDAEWALDGSEIVIYVKSKTSKIDKVLSLIHEISHHKAFIDNGRINDPKVEEAIDDEEKKRNRKKILDYEINDSVYWEDIYKDTNCQFDIKILHRQREYDIWNYEVYYELNRLPTHKECVAKRKELRKKYK